MELRNLQRQVLEQDPELQLATTWAASADPCRSVPVGRRHVLVDRCHRVDHALATIGDDDERAAASHAALIGDIVNVHDGRLLNTQGDGDSTLSVFVHGTDAVAAAVTCQQRVAAAEGPDGAGRSVRTAVVTGEAMERDGEYHGTAPNRQRGCANLANGGDVLLRSRRPTSSSTTFPKECCSRTGASVSSTVRSRPERASGGVGGFGDTGRSSGYRPAPANVPLPSVLEAASLRPLIGREGELARLVHLIEGGGRRMVWVRG